MTVSLDEQHTAYDRQQQEKIAYIGLDVHHAADHQQSFSSLEFGMFHHGSGSRI